MKISKALKQKNRIVAELNRLQNLLVAHNALEEGKTRSVDVSNVVEQIEATRVELIKLKGALAVATAPIYFKLVEMSEAKAYIKFLTSSLRVGANKIARNEVVNGQYITKEYSVDYIISEQNKINKIKELTARIENLQDEVDAFNAVTDI